MKENINISQWIKKYKYAILVLLIGVVFMLLPSKSGTEITQDTLQTSQLASKLSVSEELEQILSLIDGAGEVKVMLTVAQGEETVFQEDPQDFYTESGLPSKRTTVIVTDENKSETGLVRQINPQTYMGAIVVCQGADDPSVCLALVQAVSDVTGLRSDQISVMKMK